MKQLIAKKALYYAGKRYDAGKQFPATEGDAQILTVTGLATLAEVQESPTRRRYKRRDMQAGA